MLLTRRSHFLGSLFGTADSVLLIERIERASRPQPRGALGGHIAHASLAAWRWMRPTWFHLDASQIDVLRNTVPFVQYELAQKRRTLQHRLESQLRHDSVMSAEMSWSDKTRRRPETSCGVHPSAWAAPWSFLTDQPPPALVAVLA